LGTRQNTFTGGTGTTGGAAGVWLTVKVPVLSAGVGSAN
jgi:hypothetical protein